ncbi:hypothetical protein KM043_014696 [Ampulex compressa]|nr:hypothetical protein KM043_014696 [Ampulex compressa]
MFVLQEEAKLPYRRLALKMPIPRPRGGSAVNEATATIIRDVNRVYYLNPCREAGRRFRVLVMRVFGARVRRRGMREYGSFDCLVGRGGGFSRNLALARRQMGFELAKKRGGRGVSSGGGLTNLTVSIVQAVAINGGGAVQSGFPKVPFFGIHAVPQPQFPRTLLARKLGSA